MLLCITKNSKYINEVYYWNKLKKFTNNAFEILACYRFTSFVIYYFNSNNFLPNALTIKKGKRIF